MTALEGTRPRRREVNFWLQLGVEFVVVAALVFVGQLALHESVRSSLAFGIVLSGALCAYQVGYHEGRKDWEPAHPDATVPPPKQR